VCAVLPDPIENNAWSQTALMEDSLLKHIFLTSIFAAAIALPAYAADYSIMAPAAPGGGWDQTARTMQTSLQSEKISSKVQVMNVPGAGGTIGIAQFASQQKGNPNALLVGGYVMVGAILTNKSPVTLKDVTPIARLTGEYEAIVVPANSDIKTVADLVAKLKENPGAVSWGGGSAGGTDHILVGLLAKAAGADPTKINYIAFSGGGEALAAILGGQVTAGVSSYGEFEGQIKAGALRLLAISADKKVDGIDAPTLKESGFDVVLQNWRMVAAAPGLTDEQKKAVTDDVEKLAKSKTWQDNLKTKGWMDTYLSGPEFEAQLAQDISATETILKDIGLVK
jgi:putative tricarboxylic transport membrane protein